MKILFRLVLLSLLTLCGHAYGYSFYCTLKTSGPTTRSAPTLVRPQVISNLSITRYMLQTMDNRNPYTLLGIDTNVLDTKKAYQLTLQVEGPASPIYFKLLLTRGAGLVVTAVSDGSSEPFKYEFIGTGVGNPASISIRHRNGWATQISCSQE